jgi:hypothetical protein
MEAVEDEDDDAIETILQERFYHRPEMFYAPDKLIVSYGVPAPTPAFVYNVLGKRPLPTKDQIVADTVDSIVRHQRTKAKGAIFRLCKTSRSSAAAS